MAGRRRECFKVTFGIGTGRQSSLDDQGRAIPFPSYDRQGCVESSIFEVATPGHILFEGRRSKLTWRCAEARRIPSGIPVVPCVVCYVMVTLDVIAGSGSKMRSTVDPNFPGEAGLPVDTLLCVCSVVLKRS
jgi:hypothetical protein